MAIDCLATEGLLVGDLDINGLLTIVCRCSAAMNSSACLPRHVHVRDGG